MRGLSVWMPTVQTAGTSWVLVLALTLTLLFVWRMRQARRSRVLFATDVIAVVSTPSCGLGMVARRHVTRGEVLWEEQPLAVLAIDDAQVAADTALLVLQSDAQTVLALAQMRTGAPPDPEGYSLLPGMKVVADRIVRYQAARSFEALSPERQRRWMGLCDSLALHGSGSHKTAAGVYHSNSFGTAADGQRTSVLFEVLLAAQPPARTPRKHHAHTVHAPCTHRARTVHMHTP